MKQAVAIASIAGMILVGCTLALAAGSGIEGKWKITADTPDGEPSEWSLVFKIQDGRLTGTAEGDAGQFEFKNLKENGRIVTGELQVEGDEYVIEVTVTGDKLEGKWKLESMTGAIKGARETAQ
jgi:hypothetical protein